MSARTLLEEGRLAEAIEALGIELRSNPTDVQRRTLLFELLSFVGEFDRAEKHLDVLAAAGHEAMLGAMVYRSAIHAERTRRSMFQQGDYPRSVGERPVRGTLNGRPFSSLVDADPRIGARLELFAAGQYTWLPLSEIATVLMLAPKHLRDLIWPAAKVLTGPGFKGTELGEVTLPALAPRTSESDDDGVRLGRSTEWVRWEDGSVAPVGQKLLLVDGEEFPLLELRELRITPAEGG